MTLPLSRVALIGLRFVDAALGTIVTSGLRVAAYPSAQRSWPEHHRQRALAVQTPSGVWAFHVLPGMHARSAGRGDAAYWDDVATSRERFTFEVVDSERRFHPSRLERDVPRQFRPAPDAHPEPEVVQLHAAASRPVPPGQLAIYCELRDDDRAAAWAGLRLRAGGTDATGYAGADGSVVVTLSLPDPMEAVVASPPTSQWQWKTRVEVALSAASPPNPAVDGKFMDLDHVAAAFTELPLGDVRLVAGRGHVERDAEPITRLAL